jgi:hypothetical protein
MTAVKKEEAGEALAAVTKPVETSSKPKPLTDAELNHRFNHVAPANAKKPVFPTKQ